MTSPYSVAGARPWFAGKTRTAVALLISAGLSCCLITGCTHHAPLPRTAEPSPESSRSMPAGQAHAGRIAPEADATLAFLAPDSLQLHSGARAIPVSRLEVLYQQALSALAAGQFDCAQDLLFILQDQAHSVMPATSDSLRHAYRQSFARRCVLLSGLLAEGRAFAQGAATNDHLLDRAYGDLSGGAFPDSLFPVTGANRSTLTADLLRIDNPSVRKWEEYFRGPGNTHFQYWLQRKSAVDSLVTSILREAALPPELIYLAMIESGLSNHARSSVGAVGPWQFMPGTAKMFDLRHDWWVDERRDLELATRAAAANLQRLYSEFQDWALVLAAYNSGENRVARAIRLAGHNNYWRLRLPRQTVDFVPKFIAAARLGEQSAGDDSTTSESLPRLTYDVVGVDDATDLGLIARCAGVDVEQVQALNPALLRNASPPDSPGYPVRIPVGTADRCLRELRKVPADKRLTWRKHRVQRGDTLSEIAGRYGTTVRELSSLNDLSSIHLIRPGDQLLIPMPARLVAKARDRAQENGHYVPPDGYERVSYRVRSGDTLSGIARKLGVSLRHLRKVNGIPASSLIHPGQRLYAYRPGHASQTVSSAKSG